MEAVGSDADKAHRKMAAQHEPAWKGCGLKPGLEIWRIEKFHVEAWPEAKYGSFHEGDSYIVLSTKADEENAAKMIHTIHFWIGKDTTTDEKGTAAYKTVELDDFFDGEPVQVREAQGEESADFKALFTKSPGANSLGHINYLPGGIDTGFRHVTEEGYNARLFQIRRVKRKITELQAPWNKDSFNYGDSFIFDAKNKIYVCHGAHASPFEKNRASQVANRVDGERTGISDEVKDVATDESICDCVKDMVPKLHGC